MTNIVNPADSTTIGFTYDNANRPETRTFPERRHHNLHVRQNEPADAAEGHEPDGDAL
ncbi:MAG: hypothetical protein IPK58_01565 [Acidobacteria bacterium]|nr:hypothetical protein [Acidobacteriota bacterium]